MEHVLEESPPGLKRRDVQEGLTGAEARRRSGLRNFLLLFVNPLVAILLIAGLASALVGDYVNAAIVYAIVLLSVALNHVQTARSERAAESLRKEVAPTATALRDGTWEEIPRRELVPGDLISLSA